MKHLQIKLADGQHRTLKRWCAANDSTIASWLQKTFETALAGIENDLKASVINQRGNRLYIAYGSNLNLSQMQYRCPTAVPLANAELSGYDLKFRGRDGGAVATIEPGEDTVPVLLWKIQPRDERALDAYEGFPNFYRKENMDIELDGQTIPAMVYIMNDGHPLGTPSQRYLNTILEGYESAGFDTDALSRALERSLPEQAEDMEQTGQMDMEW